MSRKRKYSKPALSVNEQISFLKLKGLQIGDPEQAAHYLQFIGYYRLYGYAHSFKESNGHYKSGTTFNKILALYSLDRELRLFIFDAIERIEIALRNAITSVMSERYGPFWFAREDLFISHLKGEKVSGFETVNKIIRQSTLEQRYKDVFLKHYYQNYSAPTLPPSWITMETLSMGAVSKTLSLLRVEERKRVAQVFDIKERHLVSWMRALTYTRNLCAHHARLWNRKFTLKLQADKRYDVCRNEDFYTGKLYPLVMIIGILTSKIEPSSNWYQAFYEVIAGCSVQFPLNQDNCYSNPIQLT